LAYYGIKAAFYKRQGLPVCGDWQKHGFFKSAPGTFQHRRCNIGADQETGCTNAGQDCQSRFARASRHVEDAASGLYIRRGEHCRHKKTGPPTDELLVGGAINRATLWDVEARCKASLHPDASRSNRHD
jgi:hypothetical protein